MPWDLNEDAMSKSLVWLLLIECDDSFNIVHFTETISTMYKNSVKPSGGFMRVWTVSGVRSNTYKVSHLRENDGVSNMWVKNLILNRRINIKQNKNQKTSLKKEVKRVIYLLPYIFYEDVICKSFV